MDEKTRMLISIGASTACNCIPCFEHYFQTASAQALDTADIKEAIAIAQKVASGAMLNMKGALGEILANTSLVPTPCCNKPNQRCC